MKPVSGQLGYNKTADRPTVELRSGTKKLLTEDDAGGGGGGSITQVAGGDGIDTTNPTGPIVTVDVDSTVVRTSRTVTATGPYLTGGGALSSNQAIAANVGQTAGSLAAGDDARFDAAEELKSRTWPTDSFRGLTPSADSEEFDSPSMPAGWTVSTVGNVAQVNNGACDLWSSAPAGQYRQTYHHRASHVSVQAVDVTNGPAAPVFWHKALTGGVGGLTTNMVFVMGFGLVSRAYAATCNAEIWFRLFADNGSGGLDGNNTVGVRLQIGSTQVLTGHILAGGVATSLTVTLSQLGMAVSDISRFGIVKRTNSYAFFAGSQNHWERLCTTAQGNAAGPAGASAPARIGFGICCATGPTLGPAVGGMQRLDVDYIRRYDNTGELP